MDNLLSSNIKLLRKRKKIRLEDLAAKVGRTASRLSNYENGKSPPPKKVLAQIAEALGVTVEQLQNGNFSYPAPPPNTIESALEKIRQQIANNFRALRSAHGGSREDLGKALGYTGSAVYEWEMGGTMSLEALFKISVYFKVSINDMIYNDLQGYEIMPIEESETI